MKQSEIQTKLDLIPENLEKLKMLCSKSYEEFISDFRNVDSALHRLQTSIQALLDIGSYIIASLGLKTPNSNSEIVEILRDNKFIDSQEAISYIKMAQFRNRVVHLYNRIDTKVLYQILINEIKDIKNFYKVLLKIIEQHPD